jgi:meckelin
MVDFWQTVRIVLAVVCVVGVLYAFYRARAWGQRNVGPSESIDVKFLARVVVYIAGSLGPLFFWFTFGICLYWYFFYKGQSVLYLVLPSESGDIMMLELGLGVVIVCEVKICQDNCQ